VNAISSTGALYMMILPDSQVAPGAASCAEHY